MKAIIVGAGIGGLCAAVALRRIGVEATVYESKGELRLSGAGLGVGANAVRALHLLGFEEPLGRIGKAMGEVLILSREGKVLSRTASSELTRAFGPDQLTVHRSDLLGMLLDALAPGGAVQTGKTCERFEQTEAGVRVWFRDGTTDVGDLLVAADGIRSEVRASLMPEAKPEYAGYTCWRAVADGSTLHYDPDAFTETWGRNGRFGIVPLTDNRIYWFACVNAPYDDPAMKKVKLADLARRFADYHAPIPELLGLTQADRVLHRDIEFLPPLGRFCQGRVVLIGDAAHAMTPNMGQGAGQAIEDALFLAKRLGGRASASSAPGIEAALRAYEQDRVKRTGTITRMSGRIGRVAQLESRLPVALRDAIFPLVPASLMRKQLEFVYRNNLESAAGG